MSKMQRQSFTCLYLFVCSFGRCDKIYMHTISSHTYKHATYLHRSFWNPGNSNQYFLFDIITISTHSQYADYDSYGNARHYH